MSTSRASGSSQEQNSVPAYVPAPAVDPAHAQQEPGVMSVELLVQQPGREHLPVLHPNPRPGHTTWLVFLLYSSIMFFPLINFLT